MSITMQRRAIDALHVRFVYLVLAVLLALSVLGVSLFAGSTRSAGAASVTTTANLNLRTGPSLGYRIITVMPYGSQIITTGESRNGFYPVIFNNTHGWAYGAYLSSTSTPDTSTSTAKLASVPSSTDTSITGIITAAALRYGQSPAAMLTVAKCESSLNPKAVNPFSGASGLFQFMPSTWRTTPYANQNIFDATASANAAAWMWSVGRRGEWECKA